MRFVKESVAPLMGLSTFRSVHVAAQGSTAWSTEAPLTFVRGLTMS